MRAFRTCWSMCCVPPAPWSVSTVSSACTKRDIATSAKRCSTSNASTGTAVPSVRANAPASAPTNSWEHPCPLLTAGSCSNGGPHFYSKNCQVNRLRHETMPATARKRFVREPQAAAAVRDDHVVGIHAVSDEGPVPYLVMELIAGTTLAQRV